MDVMQLPLPPCAAVPDDLARRLAARGWAVATDGAEWRLEGCGGGPAWFWTLDGLARWLAKQGEEEGE